MNPETTAPYPWQLPTWQQFWRRFDAGVSPHAVLITGPEGTGREAFSLALAQGVLCLRGGTDNNDDNHRRPCGVCARCQQFNAGSHPDYFLLQRLETATQIRIEQIRELGEKIFQTSAYSGYRVALLQEADKLSEAAANALLKTLEEPPARCLLILETAFTGRLPATIRSRCQRINAGVGDPDDLLQYHAFSGLSLEQRRAPLAVAWSEPVADLAEKVQTAMISGLWTESCAAAAKLDAETFLQWLEHWLCHQIAKTLQAAASEPKEVKKWFRMRDSVIETLQLGVTGLNTQALAERYLLALGQK